MVSGIICAIEARYLPDIPEVRSLLMVRLWISYLLHDIVRRCVKDRVLIGDVDYLIGFILWICVPAIITTSIEKSDNFLVGIEQIFGYAGITIILGFVGYLTWEKYEDDSDDEYFENILARERFQSILLRETH